MDTCRWPLKCPHLLCSMWLDDETSFFYHLDDVYDLRISPHMRKSWENGRHPKPVIHWVSDTTGRKRKRQGGDEDRLGPAKQRTRPVQIEQGEEPSRSTSRDSKTPGPTPTFAFPTPSDISINSPIPDDDTLPELTYSESTPPPELDEFHSIDDFCPEDITQLTELFGEPERVEHASVFPFDNGKAQSTDDEALFSQYLWSPSPPCSNAGDTGGDADNTRTSPQTVSPRDICLLLYGSSG